MPLYWNSRRKHVQNANKTNLDQITALVIFPNKNTVLEEELRKTTVKKCKKLWGHELMMQNQLLTENKYLVPETESHTDFW